MIAIHNGEISKNFQIFKPIKTTVNNNKFKVYHDNKELFLQLPKSTITSIIQPYENMFRITLKFNINDKLHKECLDKICKIENIIKTAEKSLWKTLGKNIRNKTWIESIKLSENGNLIKSTSTTKYAGFSTSTIFVSNTEGFPENYGLIKINDEVITYESKTDISFVNCKRGFSAYIKLTCDKSIVSIFDHNKKEKSINYIIKNSEAICIIYLKHIWRTKNSMGLGWNLFQTKIFQPIQKLNECIIFDEFEENPLLHYFNVTNTCKNSKKDDSKNKEDDPVFGKYVKLKRLGANPNVIRLKLSQEGYSEDDFNDFLNGNLKTNQAKSKPIVPVKLTSSMFQNVQLKKTTPNKSKKKIKKPDNQCYVTEETLAFAIKSLKKV